MIAHLAQFKWSISPFFFRKPINGSVSTIYLLRIALQSAQVPPIGPSFLPLHRILLKGLYTHTLYGEYNMIDISTRLYNAVQEGLSYVRRWGCPPFLSLFSTVQHFYSTINPKPCRKNCRRDFLFFSFFSFSALFRDPREFCAGRGALRQRNYMPPYSTIIGFRLPLYIYLYSV